MCNHWTHAAQLAREEARQHAQALAAAPLWGNEEAALVAARDTALRLAQQYEANAAACTASGD